MTPIVALAAVALLAVAAACGGEQAAQQPAARTATQESAAQEDDFPRGGTLRVGLVLWTLDHKYSLDPQTEYDYAAWELFRCCLVRTLLSYNGTPTAEGGAEPRPDLAAELPEVSADGLTWTFRVKQGVRYAPPYEDTEIVAADVIRALERTLRPPPPAVAQATGQATIGAYAFYYVPLIEGTEAFAAGEADTISGLEAPDDHTLVVHLTEPAGDLTHRFALAATAPIPPGAADGHDDGYGPFLVPSGPYMVEEFHPGEGIALVRNPSWDAANDALRAAYPNRIELSLEPDAETAYERVDDGQLDVVLDWSTPEGLAEQYRNDPALRPRLHVIPLDRLWFAAMNVAQPPFDDVQVRRAANLAVNKAKLIEAFGPGAARLATHVGLDALEDNLLLEYDPFATPGHQGDLAAARAEMASSGYDTDGDGSCDRRVCSGIPTIAPEFPPGPFPAAVLDLLKRDLARIGLELNVHRMPFDAAFDALEAQTERHALVLNFPWAKDLPNGSGWFPIVLESENPRENASLVSVGPEQLAEWGYPVTSVPSIREEVAECIRLIGSAQTRCWAALDQLVMEQITPWIPYASPNETRIVSDRVVSISIDQFTTLPALDRIALDPGS